MLKLELSNFIKDILAHNEVCPFDMERLEYLDNLLSQHTTVGTLDFSMLTYEDIELIEGYQKYLLADNNHSSYIYKAQSLPRYVDNTTAFI